MMFRLMFLKPFSFSSDVLRISAPLSVNLLLKKGNSLKNWFKFLNFYLKKVSLIFSRLGSFNNISDRTATLNSERLFLFEQLINILNIEFKENEERSRSMALRLVSFSKLANRNLIPLSVISLLFWKFLLDFFKKKYLFWNNITFVDSASFLTNCFGTYLKSWPIIQAPYRKAFCLHSGIGRFLLDFGQNRHSNACPGLRHC